MKIGKGRGGKPGKSQHERRFFFFFFFKDTVANTPLREAPFLHLCLLFESLSLVNLAVCLRMWAQREFGFA